MMKNQAIENQPKRKLHIFAWIVCLLLAFVIWLIVSGVQGDNYKREIRNVEVVLTGADVLSGYTVSAYPKSISLTVKGDHSKVIGIAAEDIWVEVDVSSINTAGKAGKIKLPATVKFSPKFEGITAYEEYTVEVTVQIAPDPQTETGR